MVTKIGWWEPYWSHVPRFRDEMIKSGGLSARFWLRILLISTAAVAVTLLVFHLAFPGVPLPLPLWRLFLVALMVPIYVAVMVTVGFLLPPHIEVQKDRIGIAHGQSVLVVRREQILSVGIDATDPFRCRMTLRYTSRQGKERARTVGIPAKIDLTVLAGLLGAKLTGSQMG